MAKRQATVTTSKASLAHSRTVFAYLPVEALTTAPHNPRVHSPAQIRQIARSFDTFGVIAPILVDKANRIMAGHGRFEAAKLLNLPEVPVVRVDHLSDELTKAYMLTDNKLAECSAWDDHQLALILKELSDIAINFEIEATGFEAAEVDFRIQSLDPPEVADAADDFEDASGPPVTRLGDQWLLGRHRLLCANALDEQAYATLLGAERAAVVFTDPPYNVKIRGHVVGKGSKKHREFPMASGEMTEAAFTQFHQQSLGLMVAHSTEAALLYACTDWRHMPELTAAIRSLGCEILDVCIWAKPNGGMGGLYRSRHELIFVFGRCGVKHLNNVQLGKFGRNRTNVWNYPGMNGFTRRGHVRGLDLHPTTKPVAMVADAILDVTARDSIVLDPFCGSGTTLIASERTGRRGYGIELDPIHVDTAVARWQRMSKQDAVHIDGKTFDEIRLERQGSHDDA